MVEKDKLFSSKVSYKGVVNFSDFYNFCYLWLRDETGLLLAEDKYSEKLSGDAKNIEIEWTGTRELTDYFKFEAKVTFRVIGLTNVEVTQDGRKVKTNQVVALDLYIKGNLMRDYKGKFEKNAMQKFMRSIYEKGVIAARVDQYQEKIISDCDEFLAQAKAYLDLLGRK